MKSERISPFWVNGYQPFSAGTPKVLKFIEEKVLSKGFVHSLTSEYEDEEVPSSNEYTGRIPDSLFAGKD